MKLIEPTEKVYHITFDKYSNINRISLCDSCSKKHDDTNIIYIGKLEKYKCCSTCFLLLSTAFNFDRPYKSVYMLNQDSYTRFKNFFGD